MNQAGRKEIDMIELGLVIALVVAIFIAVGHCIYQASITLSNANRYREAIDRLYDYIDRYYYESTAEEEHPFFIFKLVSGRTWVKVYNCTKEEYINGSICEPVIIFVLNEDYTDYNITYYNPDYMDFVDEINATLHDMVEYKKAYMQNLTIVTNITFGYIFFIVLLAVLAASLKKLWGTGVEEGR